MNKIFGIKAIAISNYYNFACGNIASKPTVVELEQGGPLGGLAHWAVNPSMPNTFFMKCHDTPPNPKSKNYNLG
jgi:hypothetical protein